MKATGRKPPLIIWGAGTLAALSLIWSGYALTDLMDSGRFGLSVAVAGDIGWVTVLWAEYRGVGIAGRQWAAPVAGWLIAVGVAILLVIHGAEASRGQAIAGPFVVLIGKIVWAFALEAMKDPTAPTPEQQAEVHTVMRDSAHASALSHAHTTARITRIRDEARVTIARDEADFEIGLERLEKRATIARRTPLAITQPPVASTFDQSADQAINVIGEHGEQPPNTANTAANSPSEQIANSAVPSPDTGRGQASLADLVREQIASTADNAIAVRSVLAIRPDANRDSVAAAVRRERRKSQQMKGGYA